MRTRNYLLLSVSVALVISASAITTLAQATTQSAPQSQTPRPPDVMIERGDVIVAAPGQAAVAAPPAHPGDNFTFQILSSEMVFDNRVVKGAPYSADAVTETVQTLNDGNRIVRKNTAKVYRDSDGRTRYEQTLRTVGPFAVAGDPPPQSIFINDPTTGTSYVLDSSTHTARKMMLRFNFRVGPTPGAQGGTSGRPGAAPEASTERVTIVQNGGAVGVGGVPKVAAAGVGNVITYQQVAPDQSERTRTESLGTQTVEGVQAEGTRTTITIPAGEIGNERDIQIVSERWYSPELQTVVMSKRSDPLAGDTTYRLTNISRSEPPHSLFEVPSDYTLREGPAATTNVQTRRPRRNDQ